MADVKQHRKLLQNRAISRPRVFNTNLHLRNLDDLGKTLQGIRAIAAKAKGGDKIELNIIVAPETTPEQIKEQQAAADRFAKEAEEKKAADLLRKENEALGLDPDNPQPELLASDGAEEDDLLK